MRFDLEIPTTNNIKLSFIREGFEIPTSSIPLIYHKDNSIDLFPSDFISASSGYFPKEFLSGGYEIVNGPEIHNPKSDTFIITDVVKYSAIDGTTVPLFYKHIISEAVEDDAIKIIDFFGAVISKDLYIVDKQQDITNIYINKQNKILFLEYTSTLNSVKKVLLSLIPVYEESSWINVLNKTLDTKKYIYINDIISTSYDKELYIAYLSDTKLFRYPYGNLDNPWYVGILNSSFTLSSKYKYWVPEFYLQDLDTDFRYKKISDKKCKKLLENFIQTQYPIAKNALENIFIYVYDFYTKILKYAFTSNEVLSGTEYKDGVLYSLINNFNIDGVIELPIKLLETDVVYSSHYTDEYYFEYKGIDIKNIFNNNVDYVAIYIKPNVIDTGKSISHALIGYNSTDLNVFRTIEDYEFDAVVNNYFTVAILTTINPYTFNNSSEFIELSAYGNKIIDKNNACKANIDVVYNDIINGDVIIPTNDTLVACVNLQKPISNGLIRYTKQGTIITPDDYSSNYIKKVNDILSKNLDASTSTIIEFSI
jgi:hypothetical protein